MIIRLSLISRYFFSLMRGWFTPKLPSNSKSVWILTSADPEIVRRISLILHKHMYAIFQNRDLYPEFWKIRKCIWRLHACFLAGSGWSYSGNRMYEHIRWKACQNSSCWHTYNFSWKGKKYEKPLMRKEAAHMHFRFWQNSTYAL